MRKTMKKGTAIAIVLAMAAMTGCGSGNDQAQTTNAETVGETATQTAVTEKTTSDEPITLRFAWWGGDSRHQALLGAIEAYEAKNPNVKIEAEYQGYDGYYEKIMTTLSSNTAPDIIKLSKEWLPDIQGAKHYLADLSTLPVDLSKIKEGLLEVSGVYNGEPNIFPCAVGGSALYVNTDFAETYGIDLTKAYTWDEIKELGAAVHAQNENAYLLTADADMLNRMVLSPYLVQKTGLPLINEETYTPNFSEEDAKGAFQNILDLYETNTLEPFGDAVTFAGQMDQNMKWINGEIGMIIDYTGSAPKYIASTDSTLDVLPVPVTADAKCSGVLYAGDRGFAINDNSEHKEEAAKFLDFLMNDPEAIKICKTNVGFCPTTTADDILIEMGVVTELEKKGVEIASKDTYINNMISGNTDLEVIRKDLIQEVIYGDITPEEAAKDLMEQSQEVLDELKAK